MIYIIAKYIIYILCLNNYIIIYYSTHLLLYMLLYIPYNNNYI